MDFSEVAYQRLARTVRNDNIQGGYGWPGKEPDAPASSRYPNLLAEINAYTGWLYLAADRAGVSREIMAAVVEDDEALTLEEMSRLAVLYKCSLFLLAAPVLQIVDPATNKGKARRRVLADLIRSAEGISGEYLTGRDLRMCKARLAVLERGEPLTYSAWRNACQTIREAAELAQRPQARSTRLCPEPARRDERRTA